MKKNILYSFLCIMAIAGFNNAVSAQAFGMEHNQDGSYTFDWGNGTNITTDMSGNYSSSNGAGTCFGCIQTLPGVTIYGFKNTDNTTYTYTSYNYDNQYYNMPGTPPPPPPGYSGVPSQVIYTAPLPGGPPPAPVINPCTGSNEPSSGSGTNNPANINNSGYAGAVSSLSSTVNTDTEERSAFIGINTSNGVTSAIMNPDGTGISATAPPPPAGYLPYGSIHTHTSDGYPAPSAGDIYALAQNHARFPTYTTEYVIASDGSEYALVITNQTLLNAFLSAYPASSTVSGADWIATSGPGIFSDYNAVFSSLSPDGYGATNKVAHETAQSYILDKYNTGITMMKADANGNFTEFHISNSGSSGGTISLAKYNCN